MLKFVSVLRLLLPLLIPVLESLLGDLGEKFDAKELTKKLEPKIREAVPGKWFDDAAVAICGKIFEAIDSVLEDGQIVKQIGDLIAGGQARIAAKLLLDLALGKIFR